jgi:ABC-type cobalamin/Fe3+-siderophores transport system ATPase subunit
LLLADEPTASLDPPTAAKVFELFLELAEQTDAGIVLATPNRDQAEKYGFYPHLIECEARDEKIVSRLILPPEWKGPGEEGKLIVVKTVGTMQ